MSSTAKFLIFMVVIVGLWVALSYLSPGNEQESGGCKQADVGG